ncbi:MAG: hypothetical protein NC931_02065, partial [Candidatus Omnitrophica bacterium]|nr:hypothetical protein [Candidatus Omnitrophota bacterium]
RGVAQRGLERLVRDEEVGGSNPLAPTISDILNFAGFVRRKAASRWGGFLAVRAQILVRKRFAFFVQ